jgi:hypothetical protein
MEKCAQDKKSGDEDGENDDDENEGEEVRVIGQIEVEEEIGEVGKVHNLSF